MTPLILRITKRNPSAQLPTRSYPGDLGYDLYSSETKTLKSKEQMAVPTGISVQFPPEWGGVIKDRSSIAIKKIFTAAGVIDNGYRGEILIVLRNDSNEDFPIQAGDKIAQMIPVRVTEWMVQEVEPNSLVDSERNEGGFGSSGT